MVSGTAAVAQKLPGGDTPPREATAIGRLTGRLDAALDALQAAKAFAKSTYQTEVFQLTETLMQSDEGMAVLYQRAARFDEAGVFAGGPWQDSSKLQPPLVAGSLKAGGVYPVVETLSELRMLAIATGKTEAPAVAQFDANEFLNEVLALNLEFLFPGDTEEERMAAGPHRDSVVRLFALLAQELDISALKANVVTEIEQVCAQRPILVTRVRDMLGLAARMPPNPQQASIDQRLAELSSALSGPSPLSKREADLAHYKSALSACNPAKLELEASAFADSMARTGLTSPHHAVLLRYLCNHSPEQIGIALGLNELGTAELAQNADFVHTLVRAGIFPATSQAIYGLTKVLEFNLLSRQEVAAGLARIVELDIQPEVRRQLLAQRKKGDAVSANAILLAGTISALGQPLGIGQGRNPTCQAARGISLWAQHAHGYLLELLILAARDGFIEMPFEGENLRSSQLVGGLAPKLDPNLDPVSLVLTPHLDVIYDAMMKRVALRPEDGHKWVNPALYGRWVPSGFSSVFADRTQTSVAEYDDFTRRFFATHHPDFNDGHRQMYPNPVGILVTNSHGDYLGPHAVSIQRCEADPSGEFRVYFYNPNNEGRQDWGGGAKPSVEGQGEREGESSLPFAHFASRLYAFHYNPYEEGDAYAVPAAAVAEVENAAKTTWGRAFRWL